MSRFHLASYEGFPSAVAVHVHNALVRFPDTLSALAGNQSISDEFWLTLWGPKKPLISVAKSLVARNLNALLRKHVIEKETRSGVLEQFIKYNELTKSEQVYLAAAGTAGEALLCVPWLDVDLRAGLVSKVGGEYLLQHMAVLPVDGYSDDFVAEHIISNMVSYAAKPSKGVSRNLKLIFGRRPGVMDKVVPYAKRNVLTAMAGSANISENLCEKLINYQNGTATISHADVRENVYMYLALIANPRTPLYVVQALSIASANNGDLLRSVLKRGTDGHISGRYEDVKDPAVLDRLVRRACESRGRDFYSAPRPVELLALNANPNLSALQRSIVASSMNILDADVTAQDPLAALPQKVLPLTDDGVSNAYRVLEYDFAAEILGDTKPYWETLVTLLEDFKGSFRDLVFTAQVL